MQSHIWSTLPFLSRVSLARLMLLKWSQKYRRSLLLEHGTKMCREYGEKKNRSENNRNEGAAVRKGMVWLRLQSNVITCDWIQGTFLLWWCYIEHMLDVFGQAVDSLAFSVSRSVIFQSPCHRWSTGVLRESVESHLLAGQIWMRDPCQQHGVTFKKLIVSLEYFSALSVWHEMKNIKIGG